MSVSSFYKALKYATGPKLYRVHDVAAKAGFDYVPNTLESSGDSILNVFRSCAMIFKWTSPLLLVIMYRRSWFTNEGFAYMASLATSGLIVLCIALSIRAIGRFTNEVYSSFVSDLVRAEHENSVAAKALLRKYDFDFHEWPVNFKCQSEGGRSAGSSLSRSNPSNDQNLGFVTETAMDVLGYFAIHTFGRRLCYPGCLPLIQYFMTPHLIKGRAVLIEEKGGQRNKLHTVDGNDIDTMFVDRRSDKAMTNGGTLVICSEGNAGFYEVGTMATPLEAGYSVLGWNHPGFWGSTGAPFPSQERNAMDAVVQFAIKVLNFQPENIVLFAWSIGGYTASYAAMSYPDIKYVVLDATFDHLLPLAKARMPPSWGSLVDKTIHAYMNLNIADQLCRYPGPVLLMRRSKDEMITTAGPMVMASNRGNNLLIQFLQCRYPEILDNSTAQFVSDFLAFDEEQQTRQRHSYGVDDELCESLIKSYVEETAAAFPLAVGQGASQLQKRQLALFLVSKHMKEFDSTHCVPLPASFFVTPWDAFSSARPSA